MKIVNNNRQYEEPTKHPFHTKNTNIVLVFIKISYILLLKTKIAFTLIKFALQEITITIKLLWVKENGNVVKGC